MRMNPETEAVMRERFGKDSLISLATCQNNIPTVRTLDAFYEGGAFYVLTRALSVKMRQINANPVVAVSGDWFTSRGEGVSLGYFGKEENRAIADKMRKLFAGWIDNGYRDLQDENTIILKIELSTGVLHSNGIRYELSFRE